MVPRLGWAAVAGFLLLRLHAGLSLVEKGPAPARTAVRAVAMSLLAYAVGLVGCYFIGFGLLGIGTGRSADAMPPPARVPGRPVLVPNP